MFARWFHERVRACTPGARTHCRPTSFHGRKPSVFTHTSLWDWHPTAIPHLAGLLSSLLTRSRVDLRRDGVARPGHDWQAVHIGRCGQGWCGRRPRGGHLLSALWTAEGCPWTASDRPREFKITLASRAGLGDVVYRRAEPEQHAIRIGTSPGIACTGVLLGRTFCTDSVGMAMRYNAHVGTDAACMGSGPRVRTCHADPDSARGPPLSRPQANGGFLPVDQARKTLAGLGPPLPAPKLSGLEHMGMTGGQPAGTAAIPAAALSAIASASPIQAAPPAAVASPVPGVPARRALRVHSFVLVHLL
eukprot:364280-Chlamydomonas_euryale.AAC.4